jgi:hypothetical protein
MANFKRRRPRTSSSGRSLDKHDRAKYYNWMGNWPRWWDIVYHTRPKRAHNRMLLAKLRAGADPDSIAWPLGNHKPHSYYW